MPKALITTTPFGEVNRLPLELLENAGIEYLKNPFNKKITEDQLKDIISDFDVIIAKFNSTPQIFLIWIQNCTCKFTFNLLGEYR